MCSPVIFNFNRNHESRVELMSGAPNGNDSANLILTRKAGSTYY